MNFTILRFDKIDSTNTEAIKQAKLGADEGLCVLARQQTAGRGRHGRTWISEIDSGLYLSIVLRPRIEPQFLPLITLMTAVAVSDALSALDLKPDIKWVNDVLIKEKKICGILAETAETPNGLAVIVGIGVNLTASNFSDELIDTATSVEQETRKSISPQDLAELLTRFFAYFYDILNAADGPAEIRKHWQRRSSYFSGKAVTVTLGNDKLVGVTDGIESNGALRLRKLDGSIAILQTGDVERLRASSIPTI